MKYDNQLRYATEIIQTFGGGVPLHDWLKQFFREHQQMGSKDRKQLSEMVFCFYRLGHSLKNLSTAERILIGLFLCNTTPIELLGYFKPSWNDQVHITLEKKMDLLSQSEITFVPTEIFPWKDLVGNGIDHLALCLSFLHQPDLFLRIRPGHEKRVLAKLREQPIPFEWIAPSSVRLPNGFKANQLFELNKEVVIQDLSSQQTGHFFSMHEESKSKPVKAWDCCAASGGKSILMLDQDPDLQLLVSDVRPSMLANLKKRFEEADIHDYDSLVLDLAKPILQQQIPTTSAILNRTAAFDLLLLDAPCSGSGTWARNPDELYFFDPVVIDRFNDLQRRIVSNTVFSLKKKGKLVYITCSVFKKENEVIVDFIQQTYRLNLVRSEYIVGYDLRADSMFVASFSS